MAGALSLPSQCDRHLPPDRPVFRDTKFDPGVQTWAAVPPLVMGVTIRPEEREGDAW